MDRSKAIEAYTRPDLVVLPPQAIFNQLRHYRRDWVPERILYIARHVIEQPGDVTNPFRIMVELHFPELSKHPNMPDLFPHAIAVSKMQELEESISEGTFLKKLELERQLQRQQFQYCNEQAKLVRKEARERLCGKTIMELCLTPSASIPGPKQEFLQTAELKQKSSPLQSQTRKLLR